MCVFFVSFCSQVWKSYSLQVCNSLPHKLICPLFSQLIIWALKCGWIACIVQQFKTHSYGVMRSSVGIALCSHMKTVCPRCSSLCLRPAWVIPPLSCSLPTFPSYLQLFYSTNAILDTCNTHIWRSPIMFKSGNTLLPHTPDDLFHKSLCEGLGLLVGIFQTSWPGDWRNHQSALIAGQLQ